MEGHTLITAADDVCASAQIIFRPIALMANMKEVHCRTRRQHHHKLLMQCGGKGGGADNVLTSNGRELMCIRKEYGL